MGAAGPTLTGWAALGFGRLQSAAASSAIGAAAESRSTIGPLRRADWSPVLTGRPQMRSLYPYRMGKLIDQSKPGFPAENASVQAEAASLSVDNGEG